MKSRTGEDIEESSGSTGTFLLFVAVNVGSWFFVDTFVPATKGTALEELEERFESEGVQAVTTV